MTGRELFHKYVAAGLCTTVAYHYDDLSPAMQGRWDRLAEQLVKELSK